MMSKVFLSGLLSLVFLWALQPVEVPERLTGDEPVATSYAPTIGPNLSPGDSIGWTYYDYQRNGNIRQMVWVDGPGNIHADFMR
ncbi:MAG TPA: hypothetical protein EYP24_03860, partial [bacterium (Candidatus Stahlbacteria)]|nr:hypothetical protein [Candidatus Stahlbacteria bacterium]